jgi:hypothetical protein
MPTEPVSTSVQNRFARDPSRSIPSTKTLTFSNRPAALTAIFVIPEITLIIIFSALYTYYNGFI